MLREWRLFSLGWIMGRLLRLAAIPSGSERALTRTQDRYTDNKKQDDVDISRSARGLKLCAAQSVVTMTGPLVARPYVAPTPSHHVITLSISY